VRSESKSDTFLKRRSDVMMKKIVWPIMTASLLLWAVGCSDNPTSTPEEAAAVTEEFGGYTATDEAPAFGDAELQVAEAEELEVDDPLLSSPAVQEVVNDVEARVFHLRAVWGMIPYDTTVTAVTDWTGSLTISRGAILLRRLIRFEPATDYILWRTDRTLLEWVSMTTVANDGVAVDLFVPPVRPIIDSSWVYVEGGDSTLVVDTIPADPVTVTFTTGPYSHTFTLADLARLDEVITLESGNSVVFQSLQVFPNVCPRGHLAGMWGLNEDSVGVFKGFWMSGHGHLIGHVEGNYGQDTAGVNVFYGKWIDASGQFEGLLRGTWGKRQPTANELSRGKQPGGWFAGEVFDANAVPIGVLAGRFHDSRKYKDGWFQGRWRLNCSTPEDNDPDDDYDDGIGDQE
jgi:hypothetical protein